MRREWSCRESHPVDLLAGQVVILMNNPAVELSGIAPERRPCRGRWRPFAQPRGAAENRTRTPSLRTTKVTFHTTPHQRPESNQAPSFWRRRCALRSLASATPKGIEPSSRRGQRRSLTRCLRGHCGLLAASRTRHERLRSAPPASGGTRRFGWSAGVEPSFRAFTERPRYRTSTSTMSQGSRTRTCAPCARGTCASR